MRKSDYSKIYNLYESCKLKERVPLQTIKDKHGVSLEEVKNQLEIGTQVEMEHTEDRETAETIASQHLLEDIDYYKKLKEVETK